jgi:peptide/nickel transport system substrate-binding protein
VDILGLPFPPGTWYGRTLEEAAQIPGFRELDGKKHPADIEAARKLLAEAGYPEGFKTNLMARQVVEFVDVAQIAADQLKRFLNIDANIRLMESAAGQAAYLSGDYEIAVQGSSIDLIDPDGAFGNRYIEGGLIAIWMRFVNPKVQEIFFEQAKELDQVKRKALVRKAEDILLYEDNAYPGLYWSMRTYVVDNRVKNFNPNPIIHAQLKHEHIWLDTK